MAALNLGAEAEAGTQTEPGVLVHQALFPIAPTEMAHPPNGVNIPPAYASRSVGFRLGSFGLSKQSRIEREVGQRFKESDKVLYLGIGEVESDQDPFRVV